MTSFTLLNMIQESLLVFLGGHIWIFMLIVISIILLLLAMFRVPKVVFLMLFVPMAYGFVASGLIPPWIKVVGLLFLGSMLSIVFYRLTATE